MNLRVLVASVILFSSLSIMLLVYKGILISSEKSNNTIIVTTSIQSILKIVREKIQDESLKLLLVKGDVAVARASFKAYYEQSLKQQGKEYKNIDYSDHEQNKKAANYAERMVDRQQNISNPALAGDLFTSESTASKVFIKMLMPF